MMSRLAPCLSLAAALLLAGCEGGGDRTLDVAFIETPEALFADGLRIGEGAQHLRAATQDGLVGFDAEGRVIPALADSWIVTEDGRSYIFRLRNGNWADGARIDARSARSRLAATLSALDGTSLGRDLEIVDDVRAMAGRVIEIRLRAPMPQFLQLLAQPELAVTRPGEDIGPMQLGRPEGVSRLSAIDPDRRGRVAREGWEDAVRSIDIAAMPAAQAVAAFGDGDLDLVLGGTIATLPLAPTGALTRGTVRADPAIGLFGLRVRRAEGLLATSDVREALSLAIDREALMAPFGLGGWQAAQFPVPAGLPGYEEGWPVRWAELDIEQRRAIAANRIALWRSASPETPAVLSIYLPAGPGSDRLFARIAQDFAAINLGATRAADERAADLALVDRVARYAAPRWFLNQFACPVVRGPCSAEADGLVNDALAAADDTGRRLLLGEAARTLAATHIYIPFGAPVRWSLVRSDIEGFAANPLAFHPLPDLAQVPR